MFKELQIKPIRRTIDGISVRFAEEQGDGNDVLLLTAPWPESLFAFENIWQSLSVVGRLVAVDLPGFGGSERREDLLSPRAMGSFLARLISQWDLGAPHVVAPDIGTSAALFAAADNPTAIRSLVVGNGGGAYPLQVDGALKAFIDAPALDSIRALEPREVVGGAVDSIPGHELPPSIREDYLRSYEGTRFAESARYVRNYPSDLPVLAGLLETIQTPVHLVTGKTDGFVPPANAERLQEQLPHSRLSVLDAGHFLWEEVPREYASVILDWVTGGYLRP